MTKNVIFRIILLLILAGAAAGYFLIDSIHQEVNFLFTLYSSMDVTRVIEYIRSFGAWAIVISFLLMILQSVAAPLPAFLITFANAALWGWWKGAILSWTSAMAGALLCFYIARITGRDAVEGLTSRLSMERIDEYFKKYGKNTILICRLLPFVSFDFVSYSAGLTSMSTGAFLVATGIGQLPATLIYSYLGGILPSTVKAAVSVLLTLFAFFALVTLFRKVKIRK